MISKTESVIAIPLFTFTISDIARIKDAIPDYNIIKYGNTVSQKYELPYQLRNVKNA